jgi:hypothetical protein
MMKPQMYWMLYRAVMRFAHRLDWHYAPEIGPIQPTGEYQKWCTWCGLRYTYGGHRSAITVTGSGCEASGSTRSEA